MASGQAVPPRAAVQAEVTPNGCWPKAHRMTLGSNLVFREGRSSTRIVSLGDFSPMRKVRVHSRFATPGPPAMSDRYLPRARHERRRHEGHYVSRVHTSVRITGMPSRSVVLNLIVSVSPEIENRLTMLLPISSGNSALSR
jgi:hypothetical protein